MEQEQTVEELREALTKLNEDYRLAQEQLERNNEDIKLKDERINELQTLNQKLFLRVSTDMSVPAPSLSADDIRQDIIKTFKIKERK